MQKLLFYFSFVFLFFSCSDLENAKHIVGKWDCTNWSVGNDSDANNTQNVHFEFKEDKSYTYTNSTLVEKGSYKIEGGKLYTTPEGQLEIAVNIQKINADSLVLDMSRGGMPETMTLVKGK